MAPENLEDRPQISLARTGWLLLRACAIGKGMCTKELPRCCLSLVDVNTTAADALKYYDAETGGLQCSFCGKRPFENDGDRIEGNGAAICRVCIETYYRAFQEPDLSNENGRPSQAAMAACRLPRK
jgi:hypothetical protein